MTKSKIDILKKQQEALQKSIEIETKKKEIAKQVVVVPKDPLHFKDPEKASWWNPISWWKSDKTNPMILIIMSPAGDLTIRERVADQRGNLSLGKNTLYRIENNEIWDIADSDVVGFRGKRILFYHQDVPNPVRIRRDDTGTKITVNTETYAKSQKSHLLSELLAPELSFSDYISMIMTGVIIVLNVVIIFKLFFME